MAATNPTQYFRNAVLNRDDGTMHRLLRLDVESSAYAAPGEPEFTGKAWLILLGVPQALPYAVSLAELQACYKPVPRNEDKPAPAKSELFTTTMKALAKPPSEASISVSERAFTRIQPLVDNPDIFEPSKRHALLVARSKEPGCGTPKTLLKDLRYWWQGGQTQDALLGKYSNCSRPAAVGTAGRGRKKAPSLLGFVTEEVDSTTGLTAEGPETATVQLTGQSPYQLTQADLDYMKEVIEHYYFDKTVRRTLTKALDELHARHYTYLDGNGTKYLRPRHECPSYRQLRYFLYDNYSRETIETERKGKKRFALEDRSTEGSIQIECHGVGHIYEFDATILDLPLVSSANRTDIVGKPTLYLIIDRHSRLIVGWYLGFENANYSAAMQAILSIGEDKEALCRELGIPYDPADWPAHGVLPESFLADQGELIHKKARLISRSLRATISNIPGLRPDWKPLVECGIAMLHQIIAPDTPGFSADADNKQRRSVNRTRDVALNLKEALRLIVLAIIAHNKSPQLGYPLSLQQAADGVRPIPRELWRHNIMRRMGVLDQMEYEKLRAELMPRHEATVSEDGILFEGMYYTCPEAAKRGWLVEGRKRRQKVGIAFDYRLVDEIIVYAPDGSGESFVAKLAGDSVIFQGLSQREVKQHFTRVATLHEASAEDKRQAYFDYRQLSEPTRENAAKLVKEQTKGISRSGRRADTAHARAAEVRAERGRTAGVQPPSRVAESTAAVQQPLQEPAIKPGGAQVIPLKPQPPAEVNTPASDTSDEADAPSPSLNQRIAALRRGMLS